MEPRARHGLKALAEQLVHVVAVALVGGHAAGRGVRVLEQPELLERGELGADRRRPPRHVGLLGEPLRPDGLAELDVALDDLAEDYRLALGYIHTSILANVVK